MSRIEYQGDNTSSRHDRFTIVCIDPDDDDAWIVLASSNSLPQLKVDLEGIEEILITRAQELSGHSFDLSKVRPEDCFVVENTRIAVRAIRQFEIEGFEALEKEELERPRASRLERLHDGDPVLNTPMDKLRTNRKRR